jgi:hypothetical protein
MAQRIPERIATFSVVCTLEAEPGGRRRSLRTGDRFNLTIKGSYHPCYAEAVEGDEILTGETGNAVLRAIMSPDFSGLPSGSRMELREGQYAFADCVLHKIISID